MRWLTVVLGFLVAFSDAASLRSRSGQGLLSPSTNQSFAISKASVNVSRVSTGANATAFEIEPHIVSTLFSNRSTKRTSQAPIPPPTMFVAVFTTRATPIEKRQSIRQLWQEVDGGAGNICARFVVCNNADAYQTSLEAEQAAHGDLLFLSCYEGYAQGLLTRKVIAAMQVFRQAPNTNDVCLNRPLFMKVDDDTFVAGHRFREGLHTAISMYGDLIYAGVDLPSQPPQRNPASHWYEPYQTWPHQNYPPAMYGGPGYILGRSMINRIVDEGIADAHVLYNEDRAVGVWVNQLQQRGVYVNWVRIPGTNGFHWDYPVRSGPWASYPYVLHHHLSKNCIACMTNVDSANNPVAAIDPCFQYEPWT